MYSYWQKQTADKPLFPNIEWEKPERKDLAGKLLIIGGTQGSFHGVAEAYQTSIDSGIGAVKALIPESLRKITSNLPDIAYADSNLSGSFSLKSKENMLYSAQWADGVLLSGEYGRNSETAVALSYLTRNYSGLIVITKDGVDILNSELAALSRRDDTIVVCSFSQLQKVARELRSEIAFKYSDDLIRVVEYMHIFTTLHKFSIITKHGDFLIASSDGEVVTTERKDLDELWCLKIASILSVNCIQHRPKLMPSLASSLLKNSK